MCLFFYLLFQRLLSFTLFPYTTLFRSRPASAARRAGGRSRKEARRSQPVPRRNATGLGEKPSLAAEDRKSTRLNSSHVEISYAVFCLKTKTNCSLMCLFLKSVFSQLIR